MKFDIQYFYSSKHAQWIVISLVSLFAILTVLEWTNLYFSADSFMIPNEQQKTSLVFEKKNEAQAIIHSALFGIYVPNDLSEGQVQKSMLNVHIVGILLSTNNKDSQVIIQSSNGDEKSYKVGDKIPGGAVIKKVMAGAILLEHKGALESLSFPKNDLTFEPVPKPLQ